MTWTHFASQEADRAVLVLVDDRFASVAPIRELPTLTWLGVWVRLPPGSSFWDPAETEALDSIDRAVIRLAAELGNGYAVYPLQISPPGIREFYLYSGPTARLGLLRARLAAEFPEYRIETESRDDPEWSWYRSHLSPRESF